MQCWQVFVFGNWGIKYNDSHLKAFRVKIKMLKSLIRYLNWSKDKKESGKSVATTYMSSKKVKCFSSEVFATDLIAGIKALSEHTTRMISQYQQIKKIKEVVADESQKSLCINVDLSENGKFYQARWT